MRILYFSRAYTVHDYRFLQALANSCHETYFLRLENDPVAQETRPLPPAVKPLHWSNQTGRQTSFEDPASVIQEFSAIVAKVQPDLVHAGPVPTCGYIAAMAQVHRLMVVSWGSDLLI